MKRGASALLLAPLLLLGACPDSGGREDAGPPSSDGGGDAGPAGTTIAPPAEPLLVAPLQLACPAGWREVSVGDARVCDPWPETGQATCGDAHAHFPGEAACRRVGRACPSGDFPDDLPADRPLVFLRAGSTGDGTRGAPYGALSAAMGAAPAGGLIAVAAGTYPGRLRIVTPGLAVHGACAGDTTIEAPASAFGGVVDVEASGVELAHLTLRGPVPGVQVLAVGRDVLLRGVEIRDVSVFGVAAQTGGVAALEDVVIRSVRVGPAPVARGLDLTRGGRITGRRLVIDGTDELGIFANAEGTRLELEDAAVRDAGERGLNAQVGVTASLRRVSITGSGQLGIFASDGSGVDVEDARVAIEAPASVRDPRGLDVEGGSTVRVSRAWIGGGVEDGVFVAGSGTSLSIDGLLVEGVSERGVGVQTGATATASALHVRAHGDLGIFVSGEGTRGIFSDAVLEEPREGVVGGRGLRVKTGASVELTRARLRHVRGSGAFLSQERTRALLRDVTIDEVVTGGDDALALGVQVSPGATLALERVRIERARDGGITCVGPDARVSGADLRVLRSDPPPGSPHGHGILMGSGGTLALERVELSSLGVVGVAVIAGGDARLRDLRVTDVAAQASTGRLGSGVVAVSSSGSPSTVVLERASVVRATESGLFVYGEGTSITGTDLEIAATRSRPCAAMGCADVAGLGVVTMEGGHVSLERFSVADNALCGVQVVRGGTADLSQGEVSRNPIGANVQSEGFDVSRLTDRVRFIDNGVNLDASSLPVPDPTPPVITGRDPSDD